MSDLKIRIKGRTIIVVLLFMASVLLSGIVKFIFWFFGSGIGFSSVLWVIFLVLVILYIFWYLIFKFVFEPWITEFNDKIATGMPEKIAIKMANEKRKIHPPLKAALHFAENQRYWKTR